MIVFLTVAGGLLLIRAYEGRYESRYRSRREWLKTGAICALQTPVLLALTLGQAVLEGRGRPAGKFLFIGAPLIFSYMLLGIFAGCLLLACITDKASFQVYHFVWWPAWAAGAGLILLSILREPGPLTGRLAGLVCFCILQEVFFARLYGRADCHAFCACALTECAMGMSFSGFLLHMLGAVALLAAVQGIRGNINHRGNLKEKVAFLPYITVSFWLICLFQKYFCIFIQKYLHFI